MDKIRNNALASLTPNVLGAVVARPSWTMTPLKTSMHHCIYSYTYLLLHRESYLRTEQRGLLIMRSNALLVSKLQKYRDAPEQKETVEKVRMIQGALRLGLSQLVI
jgi:hypothetical protein